MIRARGVRIVNMSSLAGLRASPGQVNYSAAKAGVIGLTKTLAKEVAAKGVTVNTVAPGLVAT
jgi:3-oxoacyl-[acyl-carrier protein] reductase